MSWYSAEGGVRRMWKRGDLFVFFGSAGDDFCSEVDGRIFEFKLTIYFNIPEHNKPSQ